MKNEECRKALPGKASVLHSAFYILHSSFVVSVAGLAPARVGLKTRLRELLCIHGRQNMARKTKPAGWLLAGKP